MELDAWYMNTAFHLWCRAVFMRRESHSIRCSREKPISRYVFILHYIDHEIEWYDVIKIITYDSGPADCASMPEHVFSFTNVGV